jgi:hypothetical protein
MMDVVARSLIGITLNEVNRDDTRPPGRAAARELRIIRPAFDLHDALVVDPGLIRIAMAYGYMRAADEVVGAGANLARVRQLADEITRLRLDTWRLEIRLHGRRDPTGVDSWSPLPNLALHADVQQRKRELQAMVEERRSLGGRLPGDANGWSRDWEAHPWPPFMALWPTFPLEDGTLLREATGAIYVLAGGARLHVPDMTVFNQLYAGAAVTEVPAGALDNLPSQPRDGTILREPSGAMYVMAGGATFHIPTPEILAQLYGGAPVVQVWHGAVAAFGTSPRDGAVMREQSGPMSVCFGGAKLHIPDPGVFARLYGSAPVAQLWDGALAALPDVPRDGTLLRDEAGAIYVIHQRAKFHIPSMGVFAQLFGARAVGQVWDGALAAIPSAPSDGTLVREESEAIHVVFGGAKFHVPTPAVLEQLYGGVPVRQLWDGALEGLPSVPHDGTLLRGQSGAIHVVFGGARFHVPSMDVLTSLYRVGVVRQVWDDAITALPELPRDGTVLKESAPAEIYVMAGGQKRVIGDANALARYGGPGAVRVVPDGGLARIPTGSPLA